MARSLRLIRTSACVNKPLTVGSVGSVGSVESVESVPFSFVQHCLLIILITFP